MNSLRHHAPLCVLPWIHAQVETYGWTKVCCVSGCGESPQPVIGSIAQDSLLQIMQSPHMERIRKDMLSGVWPIECSYCKTQESRNLSSFRQYQNTKYSEYFQQLLQHKLLPKIKTLDLRISNVCNFACRSCSGWASTRWFREHNDTYPDIPLKYPLIDTSNYEDFWKDVEHLIPQLEGIHFAGGEPLVIKKHYEVLENLIESNNTEVELYYDTNLSVLQFKEWNVIKLWKQFKHIRISLSLDGVGEKGEYIRHGLNYENWKNNIETVMSELPNADRYLHFVVSIFNCLDLDQHLGEIFKNKYITSQNHIALTFLEWPPYLNVQCLHNDLKKIATERLKNMIDNSDYVNGNLKKYLRELIVFMNEKDLYPNYQKEFAQKTKLLDKKRGESIEQLFPDLNLMIVAQ
jgi:organic radical activating enzyme